MRNDRLEWQTDWISGQPPSNSVAGLDPTCLHKHKCGSCTERVKVSKCPCFTNLYDMILGSRQGEYFYFYNVVFFTKPYV